MKIALPKPDCPLGFTEQQLRDLFSGQFGRYDAFVDWVSGQTMAVCEGRRWSYELNRHEPTECADRPHGVVAYAHDVARFIAGKEPLD